MWEKFPPRMRKAITAALERAGQDGAAEATAEHLLAAIASDPECAAAFMFEQCGIAPDALLERLSTGDGNGAPRPSRPERADRFAASALHVLDVAAGEAQRLRHRHIGTEHVAVALAIRSELPAGKMLGQLGFSHERADAAMRKWIKDGMPRRRSGLDRLTVRSPLLRTILQPIQRAVRVPVMVWKIFIGKSLIHPGFVKDPYPLYRRLRETEPVRKDPLAPVWVLTRYADTLAMLRDPRLKKDPFASVRLPLMVREQLKVSDAAAGRAASEMVSMLFLDPPEHTRVRGIFTKAFTPRRLESLRQRIQLITDRRLDRVDKAGRATFDLIAELAAPLPVTVIAELLGFPPEDYDRIKRWSDEMAEALALNPTEDVQARAYRARQEIRQYFDGIVVRMKESPGENLVSALVSGEAYGERGERLDPDELFANSILLLAAGHETTTNLIGNGMLALLRHPDQLRDLREHMDELLPGAIEELLRYDPPVQWTSRVTGETLTLGGKEIERGQILLASLGAANRDPAVFTDPDRLDIRRRDNKHLSFGSGIHFCLGASLARMEAEIAIGTLIRRYPGMTLATRKLRWRKGITFRGLHELQLRLR